MFLMGIFVVRNLRLDCAEGLLEDLHDILGRFVRSSCRTQGMGVVGIMKVTSVNLKDRALQGLLDVSCCTILRRLNAKNIVLRFFGLLAILRRKPGVRSDLTCGWPEADTVAGALLSRGEYVLHPSRIYVLRISLPSARSECYVYTYYNKYNCCSVYDDNINFTCANVHPPALQMNILCRYRSCHSLPGVFNLQG